jgi:hypothetical protein
MITMEKVTSEDVYKQLELIKERPELYLGTKSLMRLDHFLAGFFHALSLVGDSTVNIGISSPIFDGFQDWIEMKYDISSDHNWFHIISFYSSEDAYAFDEFYKLFYEFVDLRKNKDAYQDYLQKREKWLAIRSEYSDKMFEIEWGELFEK